MADQESDGKDKASERPLECSECKKPIAVFYTEIVGDSISRLCMCSDCPELQKRLRGGYVHAAVAGKKGEGGAEVACGNCGTTLEAVTVGAPLGCSICYEVFDSVLLAELRAAEKIPSRLAKTKRSMPIHIGRVPGEVQEMNPSLRLLALNEALNETLQREDYEQAAWLRDQIKALSDEQPPEKKDEGHENRPHL